MEDTTVILIVDGLEETVQIEDLCYKDVLRIDGALHKVIGWSFDPVSNKPVLLSTLSSCPDHMLRCRNVLRGGLDLHTYPIISDSYPNEEK